MTTSIISRRRRSRRCARVWSSWSPRLRGALPSVPRARRGDSRLRLLAGRGWRPDSPRARTTTPQTTHPQPNVNRAPIPAQHPVAQKPLSRELTYISCWCQDARSALLGRTATAPQRVTTTGSKHLAGWPGIGPATPAKRPRPAASPRPGRSGSASGGAIFLVLFVLPKALGLAVPPSLLARADEV